VNWRPPAPCRCARKSSCGRQEGERIRFDTIDYLLFLPLSLAAYVLAPRTWRPGLLLAASYFFYASWHPAYLILIVGLTGFNYAAGRALEARGGRRRPRELLILTVGVNLGVLAYYKYSAFLLSGLWRVFRLGGPAGDEFGAVPIALPLAISFFTFEFIHYSIDVWSGDAAERSLVRFALFPAFFPTQVAGPIKRFQAFLPQLDLDTARLDARTLGEGVRWILDGLVRKIVIADRLSPVVARGFHDADPGRAFATPTEAWIAVIAFGMQVYFDFSGYTLMARGSARLFGFSVPENFNRPYLARSISEFWRRWHISLSDWLRDYLFVPLGGLAGHPYRALLVTMGLGGLWHGAGWNFLLWGLYHGALLCLHWMIREASPPPRDRTQPLASAFGWLLTFGAVTAGWALFRARTAGACWTLFASLWGAHADAPEVFSPAQTLLVAATLSWLACEALTETRRWISDAWSRRLLPTVYAAMLVVILTLHYSESRPFIYFQF